MNRPYRSVIQLFVLLAVSTCLAVGCFGAWHNTNPPSAGEQPKTSPQVETSIDTDLDGGVDSTDPTFLSDYPPSEKEEAALEDPDALEALIASKTGSSQAGADVAPIRHEGDLDHTDIGKSAVPPAAENMRLTSTQCLKQLARHNVPFERPDFKTPLVETPLLLTGPINGVRIEPPAPGKTNVHGVMDCHLVLALVELARYARSLGIVGIEFYSTYRPLAEPKEECPKGRAGKKCRAQKEQYEQTARAKTSRHRFASAIDIKRFIAKDGETLDVEADFEKRSGTDPCSYQPTDDKARVLSKIVCGLHANHIFNVMLTPNANKAHHNHFHFDVTPRASWYIVR
jgi:hypothetical protein